MDQWCEHRRANSRSDSRDGPQVSLEGDSSKTTLRVKTPTRTRERERERDAKSNRSRNPRNVIAANNRYDAEYVKYFTGITEVLASAARALFFFFFSRFFPKIERVSSRDFGRAVRARVWDVASWQEKRLFESLSLSFSRSEVNRCVSYACASI